MPEIADISGASPEHAMIITNLVSMIHTQMKDSTCRVFGDSIEYRWTLPDNTEKRVIPDVSINCRFRPRKGTSFLNAPQFVAEVLSPSTEKYDRTEKMNIYQEEEIPEYWIIDWRNKTVEIYDLDYDEQDKPKYYLTNTITENNKEELRNLIHFPHIKIDFDNLFYGIPLE